jgi:membrane fusion protein (multidrug efflux system)
MAALAGALLTACSQARSDSPASETPASYRAVHPSIETVVEPHRFVAQLTAHRHVELRARVGGYLAEILVDEGAAVSEGQCLFKIDDRPAQVALSAAQARLGPAQADRRLKEIELENRQQLLAKGMISDREIEIAQANLDAASAACETAEAEVETARIQVEHTSIRAPFTGRLSRIRLKSGSLLEEGDLLSILVDDSQILAYFRVPESRFRRLAAVGLGLESQVMALETGALGEGHPGTIDSIESIVSTETGTRTLRARFDNSTGAFSHGGTARVELQEEHTGMMTLPSSAAFEVQHRHFIYLVSPDGAVHSRPVKPRLLLEQALVIEPDLDPDSVVLIEGIQLVREGQRIIPLLDET